MHRITVNAALMCLRTRARCLEVAIHAIDPDEVDEAIGQSILDHGGRLCDLHRPDDAVQSAELRSRIQDAIRALPGHLRAIVLLRDLWEVSTEDSAAKLRVSIPAAKTRLHRARKVLRVALGQYVDG